MVVVFISMIITINYIHAPPHPTPDTMAKTIPELKKLQRNQLLRLTKEDLIESILTSPEQSNEQLSTLTATLNELIS